MERREFRAACVVGWPAKHSRSPIMHGYWLKRLGIAGEYRRESVAPEDLAAFLGDLAGHGYVGCNITQPHKEMALRLSEPDDRARAIGAANTLWLDDGRLRSTNTDVEGFIKSLDSAAPGWDGNLEHAVVLGAGGAAHAVAYGLIERGARHVHVVNRTYPRAERLREQFGARIEPAHWDDVPKLLPKAGLVANATSLGMVGNPDLTIDLDAVGDDTVIAEAVYVPLKTPLLVAAERRGLRHSDGLGMLLNQAVRPFELWWGIRPEVTAELRALMEREITGG